MRREKAQLHAMPHREQNMRRLRHPHRRPNTSNGQQTTHKNIFRQTGLLVGDPAQTNEKPANNSIPQPLRVRDFRALQIRGRNRVFRRAVVRLLAERGSSSMSFGACYSARINGTCQCGSEVSRCEKQT